jgi:hypothetical protein
VGSRAGVEAAPASNNGRSERILVVDDDHDVRAIMTSFLSEIGYVVHEAEHGEATGAAGGLQRGFDRQGKVIGKEARLQFRFAYARLACIQLPGNPLPDSNVRRNPLVSQAHVAFLHSGPSAPI